MPLSSLKEAKGFRERGKPRKSKGIDSLTVQALKAIAALKPIGIAESDSEDTEKVIFADKPRLCVFWMQLVVLSLFFISDRIGVIKERK